MAPQASFPVRPGRLSPLFHTHPPSPSGEEGLTPPEQPHPAPPSRTPSLATWRSMGVSEAPDRGLTAKQIQGEKTNWLELLAALSPFPQTPTRTKGPRPGKSPLGHRGQRPSELVRPEGWRRRRSILWWVGRGRERHTPVGQGGKENREKCGLGRGPALRGQDRPEAT